MQRLKIALSTLLFLGIVSSTAFTVKHRLPEKNITAFDHVIFDYVGPQPSTASDIQNPDNWTESTGSSWNCGLLICGIYVDDSQLDANGKPNSNVLAAVAAHWQDTRDSNCRVTVTVDNKSIIIYFKHLF